MMLRFGISAALTTAGLLMLGQFAQGQTIIADYDAELGVGNNGFDAPDEQGGGEAWFVAAHMVESSFVPASPPDPSYFKLLDAGEGYYRLNTNSGSDGDAPGLEAALHGVDGWTLTANARHVEGRRHNASVIQIDDGISVFAIELWDGLDAGDGNPGAFYYDGVSSVQTQTRIGPAFGQPGAIDSTDGFHKYQISVDPAGTPTTGSSFFLEPDNQDDVITIWVDDVLKVGPLSRSAFAAHGVADTPDEQINIGRLLGVTGTDPQTETHHNFWQFETGFLSTPGPSLEADFDSSNTVDGADLTIWQTGYGLSGTAVKSDGDANADMDVDGSDFLVWQNQNGMGIPLQAGAVGVPEPSAGLLLGLALLLTGAARRRVN